MQQFNKQSNSESYQDASFIIPRSTLRLVHHPQPICQDYYQLFCISKGWERRVNERDEKKKENAYPP